MIPQVRRTLRLRRCQRRGHNWMLGAARSREFIPLMDCCLRCGVWRTLLPWGNCLGTHGQAHPIAEHYEVLTNGHYVQKPTTHCPSPW